MKNKILKSVAIFTLLLAVCIYFENASAKEQLLPSDHVCVKLNGVPVSGADVRICNTDIIGTTGGDGCAGLTVDGYYEVVVNYRGYGGKKFWQFTPGVDEVTVDIASGNVGCDNN